MVGIRLLKRDRNLSLDLLRIFCCFCIVVLHESGFITEYNNVWTILQIFVRPCLFTFTALSGYFLLNAPIGSYPSYYLKRLGRLFIPMAFYTVIIYFLYEIPKGNGLCTILKSFILDMLTGNDLQGHLWYVYSLIGLYILAPFLKKMLDTMTNKEIILFLSISFLFLNVNPILGHWGYELHYSVITADTMLMYFVLGHLLSRIGKNKLYGKILIPLELLSILSILLFLKDDQTHVLNLYTSSINMIVGVLFYFWLFTRIQLKFSDLLVMVITFVSARTYSIYIIHIFILQEIHRLGIIQFTAQNSLPLTLFISLIIFMIALLVSAAGDTFIVEPCLKLVNRASANFEK